MPNEDNSNQKSDNDSIQSKFLNITFSTVVISTAVVLVLNPLRAIILRMSRPEINEPAVSSKRGNIFLFLYKGWQSLWYSSVVKAGALHNAKVVAAERRVVSEERREAEEPTGGKYSSAVEFTTGALTIAIATVATQIPDGVSDLKKAMPLSSKFTWHTPHNVKALFFSNLPTRLVAGGIGFTGLYLLEPKLATALDGNHFAAGAISGGLTSFFGYPCSLASDKIVHSARIDGQGRLTFNSLSVILGEMRPVEPCVPSPATVLKHVRGVGTRAAAAAAIFSTVAGVGEMLGSTPVEDLSSMCRERFFNKPLRSRSNDGGLDDSLSSIDIHSPF